MHGAESKAHIGLEFLVVLVREVLELGRHGAPGTRPVLQCRARRLLRSHVVPSTSRGSNDDNDLSVQQRKQCQASKASSAAPRHNKHAFTPVILIQATVMAAMLAPAGVAGLSATRPVQRAFSSHQHRRPRTVITVRAEDAKVTREFKEGDDKATAAKGDGALYADQIKAPPLPPSAKHDLTVTARRLHHCVIAMLYSSVLVAAEALTRFRCRAVSAEELNVPGARILSPKTAASLYLLSGKTTLNTSVVASASALRQHPSSSGPRRWLGTPP